MCIHAHVAAHGCYCAQMHAHMDAYMYTACFYATVCTHSYCVQLAIKWLYIPYKLCRQMASILNGSSKLCSAGTALISEIQCQTFSWSSLLCASHGLSTCDCSDVCNILIRLVRLLLFTPNPVSSNVIWLYTYMHSKVYVWYRRHQLCLDKCKQKVRIDTYSSKHTSAVQTACKLYWYSWWDQ